VALQRLLENNNKESFEVFNVGTGKGSSVFEVIQAFENVAGKPLNYKVVDRRPGDVIAVYADTTLANKELGWKSKRDLEEALSSAWKWEQRVRKAKDLE